MMDDMNSDYQDVIDRMVVLSPAAGDEPRPAAQALSRVNDKLSARRRNPLIDFVRSIQDMTHRKSVIALGATAVLAVLLLVGFPSVRAAANEFLGLFRVEKFAPISISPEQLAMLDQLEAEGLNPGEFVMVSEPGEPAQLASLDEARAQTGLAVRTLTSDGIGEPQVYMSPGASGYLIVDLAGSRAILEATGLDPLLLPDSLDGARVDVSVFPGVQQVWADGTVLMQTPSPYVNYPTDVDPAVLGEALLRVLGLDAEAARQMAQTIDWTSTMLLPIPREFATYEQVTIDGAPGVAIIPIDGSSEAAVMWQKDGEIFVLSGPAGVDRLLEFANFLQ